MIQGKRPAVPDCMPQGFRDLLLACWVRCRACPRAPLLRNPEKRRTPTRCSQITSNALHALIRSSAPPCTRIRYISLRAGRLLLGQWWGDAHAAAPWPQDENSANRPPFEDIVRWLRKLYYSRDGTGRDNRRSLDLNPWAA